MSFMWFFSDDLLKIPFLMHQLARDILCIWTKAIENCLNLNRWVNQSQAHLDASLLMGDLKQQTYQDALDLE